MSIKKALKLFWNWLKAELVAEVSDKVDIDGDKPDMEEHSDVVSFSDLRWDYGGFNGSQASPAPGVEIVLDSVTASGLRYRYLEGSLSALSPENSHDNADCLACLFCLLDGVWRKEHVTHFMPLDTPLDMGDGKGYPHGYPYAYGVVSTPKSLMQPGYLLAPCKLVIFGPVSSPSITIGANVYAYDGDVPSGAYLTIDGVGKTATITSSLGSVSNAMQGLVLGSGEGSGEYAFEPIKPGIQPLSWNGSFGFDAYLYEEEGEVPCCS